MSPKPLTFAISLSPYERWGGIPAIAEAARLADELGFWGIHFPEHIIMPTRPGAERFRTLWYDNFVLGAHLATVTRRVRLIFGVMVVPYRPPVQTAKLIATLDQVSGGRLVVGVGAGWLRGEFRTLGIPFAERGDMTDEYLRAMKALWTQESPSFGGKYVAFSNIAFEPQCVQKPHVPIWVGGSGPKPMRRVVELGDGWSPMTGELADLKNDVAKLKEMVRAAGRDPEQMDFAYRFAVGGDDPDRERSRQHVVKANYVPTKNATTPEEIIEAIGVHREAGFNHLCIDFTWSTPAELMRHMESFAAKVMPKVTVSS